MRKLSLAVSLAAGIAATAAQAQPARAADTIDIPVIVPLTGGGSFLGGGQRASLEAVETDINRTGGIQGKQLHFVFYDDQTSPQVAVQLTSQVLATKPPVILGSSLVAMCNAMAPLMRNGPVHFCLSPGFHPQPNSYSFSASSSSADQIAATVRYYREKGWTKLGILSSTDASGQDGDKGIMAALALPENKSMTVVAHESFNISDLSVAAQIERIKASGAQAMISWVTGAPVATVFKGMIQAGLDIPIAPTSGNQTFAQMDSYASFLPKQLILPSALWPPHDGLLTLDPRMEKVQHEMYAILQERNLKADNMVATSWDAGLIVAEGLRKLGPAASPKDLRAYIAGLTDFPGVDGIYDFTKYPERGLGPESSTVTAYDPVGKRWVWLAKPGGDPL